MAIVPSKSHFSLIAVTTNVVAVVFVFVLHKSGQGIQNVNTVTEFKFIIADNIFF